MSIRIPGVLVAAAGLAVSFPAMAQSIPWLTATGGNWSDTTKWTGGNVPDAMGETAVLGLTGAYTVTQNVTGLMLDAIDITNVDAVLNLGGRSITLLGPGITNSGTIVNNTGTGTISGPLANSAAGRLNVSAGTALNVDSGILNDGVVTINPTGSATTTTLAIQVPLTIGGTGSLVLNGSTSRAQINAAPGASLTNGVSHTIRGHGQVTAPLTNDGVVSANVSGGTLIMNSNPKTNNGVMNSAGGTLAISAITVTQGASGEIVADGSHVDLGSVPIIGGSIDSVGAGRVRNVSGTSVFSGVDSTADVQVLAGTALALAGGTYTNDGSLAVNPVGSATTTTLRIDGPLAIDGSGEITLEAVGTRAQIIAGVDGLLTLGADQLVRGLGLIGVGTVNNGVIRAEGGSALELVTASKTNNGLIEAAGGTLAIAGITVAQSATGEIVANGSNVDINAATITGGAIDSVGAGRVRNVSGTSVLSGVDSTADVQVLAGTAVALGGGTYTNDGSLAVNPVGSATTTTLRIDGPLAIDGVGEITLGGVGTRAQIIAGAGGTLTLGADQLVRGLGLIGVGIVNNGVIRAEGGSVLELVSASKANNGLIEAAGGTLAISAIAVTQSAAGEIVANGSNVDINTATITGGSIESSGAGRVRTVGGTSVFSGINSTASVEVLAGTALVLSGGAYINDGSITVNPVGSATNTTVRIDGPLTIGGTGDITLGATTSRAQIIAGADGALILGTGQTLRGVGQVVMPLTLEGAIAPGIGGMGSLAIASNTILITWQDTSVLEVELGAVSAYDRVVGGDHAINGGEIVISLVGGYTPALFATHTVIDGGTGSVVSGKFDAVTGPALPSPWVWKAGYTATDVVVGVTCPSDVNADFTVDILDFLDFIDDFSSCENQPAPCGAVIDADYNGDTFVDILDFLDFIDAFGTGC